jgi:hypothetical protein
MMKTLIPLYASLMAALTFGVHADVGSYMLEALAVKLIDVRYRIRAVLLWLDHVILVTDD